jgi:hypothetical protein
VGRRRGSRSRSGPRLLAVAAAAAAAAAVADASVHSAAGPKMIGVLNPSLPKNVSNAERRFFESRKKRGRGTQRLRRQASLVINRETAHARHAAPPHPRGGTTVEQRYPRAREREGEERSTVRARPPLGATKSACTCVGAKLVSNPLAPNQHNNTRAAPMGLCMSGPASGKHNGGAHDPTELSKPQKKRLTRSTRLVLAKTRKIINPKTCPLSHPQPPHACGAAPAAVSSRFARRRRV